MEIPFVIQINHALCSAQGLCRGQLAQPPEPEHKPEPIIPPSSGSQLEPPPPEQAAIDMRAVNTRPKLTKRTIRGAERFDIAVKLIAFLTALHIVVACLIAIDICLDGVHPHGSTCLSTLQPSMGRIYDKKGSKT